MKFRQFIPEEIDGVRKWKEVDKGGELGILQTTYRDNKFIDAEYKKLLEGLVLEDEYFFTVYSEGEWSDLKISGRVYKKFSDKNILTGNEKYIYNDKEVLNVCCDFNYDPMKWALIQTENGEDIIFDEIVQDDTDTESMANELKQKYPNAFYNIYGDYSGTSRSTRRRSTDYDIIREILGIKQEQIFVKPNPVVLTRWNIVNWKLCNKNGVRKLFVNENCEHSIKDFRRVVTKKVKGKDMKIEDQDKDSQLTHISSAIGYYINYKYTLKQLIPGKVLRVA